MSDIEMFHVGQNEDGDKLYNLRYVKGGMSLPTPSMIELEALMREHDIELDRRKSKADLLAEVDAFFKG